MPLQYDDIPGSWGVYSRGWPTFRCRDEAHVRRVFVACTKEHVVPYGSYVLVDLELRVETAELLARLQEHMDKTTIHDADEIIRLYNAGELPLHCYKDLNDRSGYTLDAYLPRAGAARVKQRRKEVTHEA